MKFGMHANWTDSLRVESIPRGGRNALLKRSARILTRVTFGGFPAEGYIASIPPNCVEAPGVALTDTNEWRDGALHDFSMTALISWVGVDQRGASSLYLAGDSRISWNNEKGWNAARKVFASRTSPQLFAYSGDVLLPMQILSNVLTLIDNRVSLGVNISIGARVAVLREMIRAAVEDFPRDERRDFTILYALRDGAFLDSVFYLFAIEFSRSTGVTHRVLTMPPRSGIIVQLGSGSASVRTTYQRWTASDAGGTSRAAFGAFCDAIRSATDLRTGGAPQLVRLYRKGNGAEVGIIHDDARYINGGVVGYSTDLDALEWRNELFERCSPTTLGRVSGGQPQPRPRNA
jgi:hypothetical protein